ncbi:hypothetical protein [Paenibacillus xylanexedens]|uniref:hypothetical protein n=1 Tax=Paenibacillus xylanexedens TaxID=528191 RepID=UPI00119D0996|nr:hypothetical protein [Paenibacillus xylanexedens]
MRVKVYRTRWSPIGSYADILQKFDFDASDSTIELKDLDDFADLTALLGCEIILAVEDGKLEVEIYDNNRESG